jgi:glycosyltransferase involved in cell wall biosynthesis
VPPTRPLRIAWLGGGPAESGGAPGVVTELLDGLSRRGHQIDCFVPGAVRYVPEHLCNRANLQFISGTNKWRWDRWYSRTKITSFASGLIARASGALRLRRELVERHERDPYDVIFQNQTIESLGVPAKLARVVPLVVRPDTHQAGELRWLIAERRLAFSCQPRYVFFLVAAIMAFRALVQAWQIRRASLLICISGVFRDHIVHDYRFPREKTVVIANPVRLDRFTADPQRALGEPPVVLVPTRLSLRKGLEDVVQVARRLAQRGADAQIRVVGGPSTWSDYSKLLDQLPAESSQYGGRVAPRDMPDELRRSDVVLVTSKYEPFGLTVAEALASGVPVIATREVGAIEGVDSRVATAVAPGDVAAIEAAIEQTLQRLRTSGAELRSLARAEAERRFARDVIGEQISDALERLVKRSV